MRLTFWLQCGEEYRDDIAMVGGDVMRGMGYE
jgi:hypothetical protein